MNNVHFVMTMNTAHDVDIEADYETMLRNMEEANRRRKAHEAQNISLLKSRDLYDLDAAEYQNYQRQDNGFEDLFDTEYLFSHHTASVDELSRYELHT